MSNCEYSDSCFFFNKIFDEMPKTYGYMKKKYCESNFSACDRFKLYQSIGITNVPNELSPICFRGMQCFSGM